MGAWAAGLYQDDFASDLKSTISQVSKVPVDGDRLLDILCAMQSDAGIDEDDECTFWLVVADQFERRGIACLKAFEAALSIIDSGRDMRRFGELGLGQREVIKRNDVLQELANRLRSPRPTRPRRAAGKKPPEFVVEVGEIYVFRTMSGAAANAWFATWEQAGFQPDGWGALVVLQKGRVYDWLPWVSVASLTVPHESCPSLDDALGSRLLMHLQTNGAAKVVPRRSHLKRTKMQLLGRVQLDAEKAAREVSTWSAETALDCGWSLSSAAFSSNIHDLPIGPCLADLLEEAASNGMEPTR